MSVANNREEVINMSKPLKLEGERYDRLLVIKRDPENKGKWRNSKI